MNNCTIRREFTDAEMILGENCSIMRAHIAGQMLVSGRVGGIILFTSWGCNYPVLLLQETYSSSWQPSYNTPPSAYASVLTSGIVSEYSSLAHHAEHITRDKDETPGSRVCHSEMV